MLDGPVPDGARSVSWPWYHQLLTHELTPEAKELLSAYSGVPAAEMEAHVYSIVGLFFRHRGKQANDVLYSETKLGVSFHGLVLASSGS